MTEQIPAEPKNATGQQDTNESDKASQVQRHSRLIWTLIVVLSGPIAVGASYGYDTIRSDASETERLIALITIAVVLFAVLMWLLVILKQRIPPPKTLLGLSSTYDRDAKKSRET